MVWYQITYRPINIFADSSSRSKTDHRRIWIYYHKFVALYGGLLKVSKRFIFEFWGSLVWLDRLWWGIFCGEVPYIVWNENSDQNVKSWKKKWHYLIYMNLLEARICSKSKNYASNCCGKWTQFIFTIASIHRFEFRNNGIVLMTVVLVPQW